MTCRQRMEMNESGQTLLYRQIGSWMLLLQMSFRFRSSQEPREYCCTCKKCHLICMVFTFTYSVFLFSFISMARARHSTSVTITNKKIRYERVKEMFVKYIHKIMVGRRKNAFGYLCWRIVIKIIAGSSCRLIIIHRSNYEIIQIIIDKQIFYGDVFVHVVVFCFFFFFVVVYRNQWCQILFTCWIITNQRYDTHKKIPFRSCNMRAHKNLVSFCNRFLSIPTTYLSYSFFLFLIFLSFSPYFFSCFLLLHFISFTHSLSRFGREISLTFIGPNADDWFHSLATDFSGTTKVAR